MRQSLSPRSVWSVWTWRPPAVGPAVPALLLLPLVLLAVDSTWVFPAVGIDSWVYLGYSLDLTDHLRMFDGQYYGTRLSAILPGWLAHKLFKPVTANCVLHLAVYYASVFSLYGILTRAVGRRAAATGAVLMGTHHLFLFTVGNDYVDSYGVAYFLVGWWLLGTTARSRWAPAWAAAAGAAFAALVVANIFYAILLPFPLLVCAVEYRAVRGRLPWRDGVAVAVGAVGLVLLLGWLNAQITGRFWFFLPSFSWTSSFLAQTDSNPWQQGFATWAGEASWLVVPVVATLGAVAALPAARRAAWTPAGFGRAALLAQMVVLFGAFAALDVAGKVCPLQFKHYASLLIPPAFLALGVLVDPACRGVARTRFAWVVVAAVAALAVGMAGWVHRLAEVAGLPQVVLPTAIGVTGVALLRTRGWGPAGGVVALALCVGAMYPLIKLPVFTGAPEQTGPDVDPYDRDRRHLFEATVDVAQAVRSAREHGDAWFWYDAADPCGGVYICAASTSNYGYRLVGTKFPDLSAAPDHVVGRLQSGGTRVVLLSREPAAEGKAVAAMAAKGVTARPVWRQPIRRGPVAFDLTMFVTSPAPVAADRRRELVPGGIAWSALEPSNGTVIDRRGTTFRFTTPGQTWAYAAVLPLTADRPPAPGGEVLSVRLTVDDGVVGVGLLTPDGREILGERFVRAKPGEPQTVEWLVPTGRADRVVFRTGDRPTPAVVTVDAVDLYALGRP